MIDFKDIETELTERCAELASDDNHNKTNVMEAGRQITANYLQTRFGLICEIPKNVFTHFQKMIIKIMFFLIRQTMLLNESMKAYCDYTTDFLKPCIKTKSKVSNNDDIRFLDIFGDKMNLPELHEEVKKRKQNETEINSKNTSISSKKSKVIFRQEYVIQTQLQSDIKMYQKELSNLMTQIGNERKNQNTNSEIIINDFFNEVKLIDLKLKESFNKLKNYTNDTPEKIFSLSETCTKNTLNNSIFCNTSLIQCHYCGMMKLFLKNCHAKNCKDTLCYPKCQEYRNSKIREKNDQSKLHVLNILNES